MRKWSIAVLVAVASGCSAAPQIATGDAMPASVRIIRGDPAITDWVTLTIEGHGLTALEGRLVGARIGNPERPPERLGSGEARVENGAFSLTFPDVWEPGGTYKQKVIVVDTDADGACTAADLVCLDSRASEFNQLDVTLTLPGSVPLAASDLQLYPSPFPTETCQLWNMP